jgi:hypothetical protein
MTKIYEALQQFDIEQSVSKRSGLEQSGEKEHLLSVPLLSKCDIEVPPALTEILIGLYRTVFTVVPGPGGRIIQFVESGKGAGCSKLIRAFAKVSSSVLKKSVLLLDSDPQVPSNFDLFNQKSAIKWISELKNDRDNNSSKSMPDKNLLSVSRLSIDSGLLPVDTGSAQTKEFMEKLKDTFDLILVDSWSVAIPPRPRLFSPHVDGIVLVIDAGKTRWQIAEKQKRELTAQGGNVLGVILNNRTYPIPDSIYNRLYG